MVRASRGFALIELLVVITIIGILVGLLLPGVQAAREMGRRATCANNIRNLSLACTRHVEKVGFFPTGGWGTPWQGHPDRGCGKNQTGGWIYNILPYIEQDTLHDMGADPTNSSTYTAGSASRIGTPLALLYCPTRRRVLTYPLAVPPGTKPLETDAVSFVCKNDYAINGGSNPKGNSAGPTGTYSPVTTFTDWPDLTSSAANPFNGISAARSEVTAASVSDGYSYTYLLGEKYINPDEYTSGMDLGDKQDACSGDDSDLIRWGSVAILPMLDQPGVISSLSVTYATLGGSSSTKSSTLSVAFGSAHSAGWNVAFCDGSVRLMNFTVDPQTHAQLASRNDHIPIDPTKF